MFLLVHQLSKNYLGPHKYTSSFGIPLGHLKEDYCLTRGQNNPGGKNLHALKETTQDDLECFVGTLVSTAPAVW